MEYPVETFSEEEKARLAPHFTNLDRPVFALVGLPETVKGALFARYSRYQGTLRRLYLDEFAGDVAAGARRTRARASARPSSTSGSSSATATTRWRSSAAPTSRASGSRTCSRRSSSARGWPPTSSSPRATSPTTPRCRAAATATGATPSSGPSTSARWTACSTPTRAACRSVEAWAAERFPRADDEPESAYRRSIKAKALDLLRGLLPAASLSHMGIFASGQAYEQLVLHLMASPLPEARDYGSMILTELNKVIPSFLTRVERPDRGGEWIDYLRERGEAAERWAARFGLDRGRARASSAPSVRLLEVRGSRGRPAGGAAVRGDVGLRGGDPRDDPGAAARRARAAARASWSASAPTAATAPAAASRRSATASRSSPTTAPSATSSATACSPSSGSRSRRTSAPGCPRSSSTPGVADDYRAALDRSRAEYERLVKAGHGELAPYALCLGYRIRYVLDMNAREAMHLIELRSGREGHPAYRAVAHELHAQIAAVHPRVAAAMTHVDRETEPRLERILSEIRTQAKRASRVDLGARRPTGQRAGRLAGLTNWSATRSVDRRSRRHPRCNH